MKLKKGKRLVDVLDDNWNGATGDFLIVVQEKMIRLHNIVNKPSPNIENTQDLKWVEGMMDNCNGGLIPSKGELKTANILWDKYK